MTQTDYQRPPHGPVLPTDPAVPKACSFAGVRDVLKSKDLSSATHVTDWELLGGTVMTVDGAEHTARRRLESALFKPQTLKWYERTVLQPAIEATLQRTAETARDEDGLVRSDLVRLGRLIMLSISAAVIGLDDVDGHDRRERLGDCLDALIEGTLVEWSERDHGAIMADALTWKKIYGDEFVAPALARRRERHAADPTAATAQPDLLSVLVADTAGGWDDERILRECTLYLVASSLTTSTAMTHTVGHLDAWLREHPADRAKLGDSDFLRAAAMESLRLHPGPHILLRRATADLEVPAEGITVHPGQVLGADVREGNRDTAAYGPTAAEFDPRRELHKETPASGFTFGGGRHMCIGRPLALGNYGGRNEDEMDGILVRMLKGLYAAGVTPDADRPAAKADSIHDRYERYPVVFTDL
jgi:cytochrome P450